MILPSNATVLLLDPSEKGALPLYTAMIAEGLFDAGLQPAILGNRYLTHATPSERWPVLAWLPAGRWPLPPGAKPPALWNQLARWWLCAVVAVFVTAKMRPSIIHIQYPIHPRLDWILLKVLRLFAPVVWTAHDVLPHYASKNAINRSAKIYLIADAIIVHSVPAAEEVLRMSDVIADVIDHPVANLKSWPTQAEARDSLGIDHSARLASVVGFIRTYKNYQLLADIWDILGDHAPLLLVLGELVDESERESVKRLQNNPRADVRLGYASDADIIAALAAADVVLLPHQGGSDSGTLHMSRAVRTPVFSSDTAQLGPIVLSTGSGRVFKRDPGLWASALSGPLPERLGKPTELVEIGLAHLRTYRRVASSRRVPKSAR